MYRRLPTVVTPSRVLSCVSLSVFNSQLACTTAIVSTCRRFGSVNGHNDGTINNPLYGPTPVVHASFDRFGGEAAYIPPKAGEEIDVINTANVGAKVPWPEVQRQLQLFVSNAATDTKSATKGRTFLRDFDVLSNISNITEGLELLYYMQRLSYPPASKLETSLVSWLIDNAPLITTEHLLDICRYAVEQQSYDHWKRCLLLDERFISRIISLLLQNELSATSQVGFSMGLEDLVLVARVMQHSKEEVDNAQKKSLMPGVEYAKKRPVFRVLVQRVSALLEVETDEITPEVVGNILKHIATLDPSCPAQPQLLSSLVAAVEGSTATDALRYLTAMSESGASFPKLVDTIVDRIHQHALTALKPSRTKRGQRKGLSGKKANIRTIRDDPETHKQSDAVVDITFITRSFLLIHKLCPQTPQIGAKLLDTLRPAVDVICSRLLADRARMLQEPSHLTRLLSDLCEVADVMCFDATRENDPTLVALRTFVRRYVAEVGTGANPTNRGIPVDSTTMEECGFCLRIASKLLDPSLTSEIATMSEVLCGKIVGTKGQHYISLTGSLRVLEGLAAAGSFPPSLVEMCIQICLENRSQLSSRNVATAIFVAGICRSAKFDSEVFHQLTGRLLNTAKFRRHDVLGPNAVAQLLRGLAAGGVQPDDRLQAFLGEQVLKYTSEFSVRDSISLLVVVHQLKLDQSSIGQRLGVEVASAIPTMGADDLVRLASVLAELNIRDVCMLDAIGYRLRDCAVDLKSKHITEFAMSLRELNFSSMFAKCALSDLVPILDDLTPNEATFLMAFCPPHVQETIIEKFIQDEKSIRLLNPASLITVYGAAPLHMESIRVFILELLVGKEAPLTVSADVGCLALCRAITSPTDSTKSIVIIVSFLAPIAQRFTGAQLELITDQLRRVIVESIPEDLRLRNIELEETFDKEERLQEYTKENVIRPSLRQEQMRKETLLQRTNITLDGAQYDVPAPFFRFFGRRVAANVDFLSIDTCMTILEIYMHGAVRDDKVVKTLFRRVSKMSKTLLNSPRMFRVASRLIDYFSVAWAASLGTQVKQRASLVSREIRHSRFDNN